MVDTILNVVSGSCKRCDQLHENRRAEVVESISSEKNYNWKRFELKKQDLHVSILLV
jgi:hypothetical protein